MTDRERKRLTIYRGNRYPYVAYGALILFGVILLVDLFFRSGGRVAE